MDPRCNVSNFNRSSTKQIFISAFLASLLLFFPLQCTAFSLDIPILYTGEEPGVHLVNSSNLKANLFNQSHLVAFEFYNSWCGHCARFAPIWKQFAADIRRWHPVVRTLALDCAVGENSNICRDYLVEMYPSVRLFWPYTNSSDQHGHQIEDMNPKVEFLKDYVIKTLEQNLTSKSIPPHWPSLLPINTTQEWEQLKVNVSSSVHTSSKSPLLWLVEENDSRVGSEIILDLSAYTDKITVRRVLKKNNELLSTVLDSSSMTSLETPSLIEINPLTFSGQLISSKTAKDTRETLIELINSRYFNGKLFEKEEAEEAKRKQLASQKENNKSTGQSDDEAKTSNSSSLNVSDLYGALQFTLFNQIPLKKSLNATQVLTLQRFFRAVHSYFPFDEQEPAEFIERLLNETLKYQAEMPIDDYLQVLRNLKYDFSSRFTNWATCRGSLPNYRGYPCSLWSLFHTLTVREYVHANQEQKWVNLHEVLFTMRDYIANFFSCSHCAAHFASMASDLEQQLQQPNSSVLWLWNAHNKVNRRLAGDITEDPEHPKVQFPSQEVCPKCWIKTISKETIKTKEHLNTTVTESIQPAPITLINSSNNSVMTANETQFNETEVLLFLIQHYDLKLPPYRPPHSQASEFSALQSYETEAQGSSFTRRVLFNYTDMSICFTLYFLTTVLLFTIFFVLRMRNRRKKYSKKSHPFIDF